ncbi:Uncharacterized protein HZ326_10066 [Fusarium oxysporum f. sp. albedinis]|nr:Uncharacterized protein HZ326_10066 [Fusarium oxysporum f. sp. albedinis]
MSRAILVTGATGNQGGAVIDALLSRKPSDFLLLAVTRDAKSPSAQSLAAKSPSSIRLVEGDLDSSDRNGLVWSGMGGQTKPYQMLT